MGKLIKNAFGVAAGVLAISLPAFAGNPTVSVPEPGMLPLFAIAAVAFYIAKKRKK